jgi:hypothetical protein
MVILDITAVNIALPSLARDLQLSGSTVSWTITSYSLVFGSLLLFGGRLADLVGRRRMFLTGLGVFTVSSSPRPWRVRGSTIRSTSRPGSRRRDALAGRTLDHHDGLPGQAAGQGARGLGCGRRAGAAIGVLVGGVLTEVRRLAPDLLREHPVAIGLAVAA